MPLAQGTVGPSYANDGSVPAAGVRIGRTGETMVSEIHGRFYEQVYRGNVFSIGTTLSALSANTITLVAATTPILGVWNPPASTVNLVMLQAALGVVTNAGAAATTGHGALVWASSVGNTAITTGQSPFNHKTLATTGSQAKAYQLGGAVALTGLTNNLVIFEGADLPIIAGTATGTITASTTDPSQFKGFTAVHNFDGALIVPPGGVLALLNTTSTTTTSAVGRLLWEEVPL
jgi:hypothetical protein